jgi:hypothetical protein
MRVVPLGLDWQEHALCRRSPLDFNDLTHVQQAEAIALCHTCPVERDCLAYAVATDPRGCVMGGVWWPFDRRPAVRRAARQLLAA